MSILTYISQQFTIISLYSTYQKAIYDHLFSQADPQNSGYITGPSAVSFLSYSKLPVDLLKTIWSLSDVNPTNKALDKCKFITAVRLIQLCQNGRRPAGRDLRLGSKEEEEGMRPPYFKGIALPSQQQPQQQQLQRQMIPQQQQQQDVTASPDCTVPTVSPPTNPTAIAFALHGADCIQYPIPTTRTP